jgi:hypothetical protein
MKAEQIIMSLGVWALSMLLVVGISFVTWFLGKFLWARILALKDVIDFHEAVKEWKQRHPEKAARIEKRREQA